MMQWLVSSQGAMEWECGVEQLAVPYQRVLTAGFEGLHG